MDYISHGTTFVVQEQMACCTQQNNRCDITYTHTQRETAAIRFTNMNSDTARCQSIVSNLTSSFSALCRSRHSSVMWLKSTLFMGTLMSPMASCLEKRSKSYTVITSVFPPSSTYGTWGRWRQSTTGRTSGHDNRRHHDAFYPSIISLFIHKDH